MADTDFAPAPGTPAAAAMDRIENAVVDDAVTEAATGATGAADTPTPPAGSGSDGDLPILDANGQPYLRADELRAQLKQQREQLAGYDQALKGFPEDQRNVVMQALAGLGPDAPLVTQVLGAVHPDDARVIAEAIQIASTDPKAGAERFAAIAAALGGTSPSPAGDRPPAPAGDDDPDRPMTRAEMQTELARLESERVAAAEMERTNAGILDQAKQLGYDLDSQDPVQHARAITMLEIAAQTSGDPAQKLIAADAKMKAWEQSIIDGFVDGKRADALRPGQPANGAPDSGSRELHTMGDAKDAAMERINAAFGPERPRQ